ncbi:MAG: universal stress protein [Rhodanobacter sp.]
MFKRILLPIDGSDLSLRAAKLGVELAQTCSARVHALHVVPSYQTITYVTDMLSTTEAIYTDDAVTRAEDYLQKVRNLAENAGVKYSDGYVIAEQPFEVILQTAGEQHSDLIVMGSHGRRGLTRLLLGSETQKVLLRSDVPVMVCH